MLPPTYQDGSLTHRADTCGPLVAAAAVGEIQLEALVHGHYPGQRLHHQVLPGMKTMGFWDAKKKQDWGLDSHFNEGIELTWLETGALSFAVGRASYQLRANDLTITRPWQQHRVGNPHVGAGRLYWLILDVGVRRPHQQWRWPNWVVITPKDLSELTAHLRLSDRVVWHGTSDLAQCFQRIGCAISQSQSGDQKISLLTVLINALLVHLLEIFRQNEAALDPRLAKSQRTVELFWSNLREHLEVLGAEWNVERMAHCCGLGTTQFIHLTKQLFNRTPGHYLTISRLESAAQMLVSTPDMSITEVAHRCGFSSSQYFATLFGEHFHCKPSEFRKSAKVPALATTETK